MAQMATPLKVCNITDVCPRAIFILALCLILATVRIAGTHAHFVELHHDGTERAGAATHHIVTVDEYAPDHLESHLSHGQVDADDSVESVAKLFLSGMDMGPVLLLLTLLVLFEPRLSRKVRVHRPELRPPARRSAFELTPPAHAPPVAP
jgi:hypothetical protein